jgi:hypothetical protein
MARPKKDIDFNMVDKLLAIQCTGEEIASVLNINYDTLEDRVKKLFKVSFSDYSKQKRAGGKASLRRMQWKKAENGDSTMLIWLGKQYLEQKEKHELEHSGNVGVQIVDDIK